MRGKKILYIDTKGDIGGALGNMVDIMEYFVKSNKVYLMIGSGGPLAEKAQNMGVEIIYHKSIKRSFNPIRDLLSLLNSIKIIKELNPDIIHCQSVKGSVIGRIAGWWLKIPTVFTPHGWLFSEGSPPIRKILAYSIEKLLIPVTKAVVCISKHDIDFAITKRLSKNYNKFHLVYYGIKPFTGKLNLMNHPPKFIMVARFNEQKDQETLIKAIAKIKETDFFVEFAGSGPSFEKCKALVKYLNIEHKVIFHGERKDVNQLLVGCQGFVLSTNYEGLPISILEAMSLGMPILGTDTDGIPEEVESGMNGFLIPRKNSDEWANKLLQLINNPQLRNSLGQKSKEIFETKFSLTLMHSKIENIYQNIL